MFRSTTGMRARRQWSAWREMISSRSWRWDRVPDTSRRVKSWMPSGALFRSSDRRNISCGSVPETSYS